jgi:hypothetical protein
MSFDGSCKCGVVSFTVDAALPTEAISCNCSHCRRKGFLLAAVPADKFTLASGADAQIEYRFNTEKIAHKFCATCGCQAFSEGVDKDGKDTRMVNLRCVPEADLGALKIIEYDGAYH